MAIRDAKAGNSTLPALGASPLAVAVCAALLFFSMPIACDAGSQASAGGSPKLRLYAAASLTQSLEAVLAQQQAFEHVRLVSAASSTLARQLEAGAPPGVYISASPDWMGRLTQRGRLQTDTRKALLGNRLLLVRPTDVRRVSIDALPEIDGPGLASRIRQHLSDSGRLCLADPDHVPAGVYARTTLLRSGLWAGLRERILPGADARRTVWYLARGACDLGIVYQTDLPGISKSNAPGSDSSRFAPRAAESSIAPVGLIDTALHDAIVYEIAIVRGAPPAARELYDFLFSPGAQRVFQSFGFVDIHR
ncbi:MAG: molybdate ABC transporter substrate-binding protein [bacterium]|nr:molybdate ABC transporter substrate-binding protein [bacterium]